MHGENVPSSVQAKPLIPKTMFFYILDLDSAYSNSQIKRGQIYFLVKNVQANSTSARSAHLHLVGLPKSRNKYLHLVSICSHTLEFHLLTSCLFPTKCGSIMSPGRNFSLGLLEFSLGDISEQNIHNRISEAGIFD